MIHKTWTHEGFTEKNIDAVKDYIDGHMYGYGLCHPLTFEVYKSDLGMKETVSTIWGGIDYMASTYK